MKYHTCEWLDKWLTLTVCRRRAAKASFEPSVDQPRIDEQPDLDTSPGKRRLPNEIQNLIVRQLADIWQAERDKLEHLGLGIRWQADCSEFSHDLASHRMGTESPTFDVHSIHKWLSLRLVNKTWSSFIVEALANFAFLAPVRSEFDSFSPIMDSQLWLMPGFGKVIWGHNLHGAMIGDFRPLPSNKMWLENVKTIRITPEQFVVSADYARYIEGDTSAVGTHLATSKPGSAFNKGLFGLSNLKTIELVLPPESSIFKYVACKPQSRHGRWDSTREVDSETVFKMKKYVATLAAHFDNLQIIAERLVPQGNREGYRFAQVYLRGIFKMAEDFKREEIEDAWIEMAPKKLREREPELAKPDCEKLVQPPPLDPVDGFSRRLQTVYPWGRTHWLLVKDLRQWTGLDQA